MSLIDASSNQEVKVSPIAQPAPVIEVLKPINPMAKLRNAKRTPQAKPHAIPAMMLSRSERQQMGLLRSKLNESSQGALKFNVFDDDDDDLPGYDELSIHQFYSRPKLVKDENPDDTVDSALFNDTVKLRLTMARLKALEAHALAHATDDGEPLPERVSNRLAEARAKALARFTETHSEQA